jgi:hypothetical protein
VDGVGDVGGQLGKAGEVRVALARGDHGSGDVGEQLGIDTEGLQSGLDDLGENGGGRVDGGNGSQGLVQDRSLGGKVSSDAVVVGLFL